MSSAKILIVDDEIAINNLLKSYVQKESFVALSAYSGKDALKIVKETPPDLIILDVMLPDMTGVDLCLEIRKISDVPILFLSCKSEEIDKIIALSVGGDDYITKPFLPGELIARIKAHLRRQKSNASKDASDEKTLYQFHGLCINTQTREVFVDGCLTPLTAKEFDILHLLVKNPQHIFSAEQLFEQVWKTKVIAGDSRTLMVYVSTLRKKIEKSSDNPKYILSIRGVGYKFNHHLLP